MNGEEEDPVLIFSDLLEKIVLRAQSWPDAIGNLRTNMKTIADAERQVAKTMKKIASNHSPVCFAQNTEAGDTKGEEDSLAVAASLCFVAAPQQLAAHHDTNAAAIMEVYTGKAAALEKLAKKHRGAVEGEAQGLWEGVVKARENLARAKRQSQALSKQDPSQVQAAEKDRWLSELQLISFRQDEREASSAYCTQVLKLWEGAQRAEKECVELIKDVMAAFMAAQTGNVIKLDVNLQGVTRGLKVLDGDADWTAFRSQGQMDAVRSGQISTDWKAWNVDATIAALGSASLELVMQGDVGEGVVQCGWLHRQGSVLKFNWHKHWFVLTKYGTLHYFPSKICAIPEETLDLNKYSVDAKVEKDILTVTMSQKSSHWFSTGSSKKLALSGEDLVAWAQALSAY